MTTVPFLDLKAATQELRAPILEALTRATDSGWYVLGKEVNRFEEAWASWTGAAHAVGVANGLDALTLGLQALGVGPGDEVIVPSNTYIATWLAVSAVGATVVPVEPSERTHNLDVARVEQAVTARTKVILPVHLYGQAAELRPLMALAQRRGLKVLDDAAQSHGATVDGVRVGGLTHLTAWSFYPGKNLGALGDAGAVTTSDAVLADKVRVLRNYGSRVKYANEVRGVNSRLDELQAAVLSAKLPSLDHWNQRRVAIAERYQRELAALPLVLPVLAAGVSSVWHLYVVRHPRRDALQAELKARGVETLIHYPTPPFLQPAYPEFKPQAGRWPIADRFAKEVLSLPIGPHLTSAQQTQVIAALEAACRALG